ncbi:hypothetical protein OWM07_08695 [Deferribacter thermophilus]|uniref:hypothetical protein n=1 Tax=Deferribacter thermophilus TaxID=53573 RepID=UPI003C16ACBB
MKKLLVLILIIFSFAASSFSATYESIGEAIIENNNLKVADKNALNNALISAIKKHFEYITVDKSKIPEITSDFIRFIKSYKILDRYVKEYTVYYHLLVDVDEITVEDLPLFFNTLKQSIVFYSFTPIENLNDENINKTFEKYDLSLKYQGNFLFNLPANPTYDDILNEFTKNDAKYLLIINFKQIEDDSFNEICKTELSVDTFTKNRKFKTIKIISTKSNKADLDECLKDSYISSLDRALKYIKNNYIKLPTFEKNNQLITITFINFRNFTPIQNLLEELSNRRYITEYKVKSFSMDEAIFDVNSVFNTEDLIAKLKLLKNSNKYNIINFAEGQIVIDFQND